MNELIVGLETHVELSTKSKIFCRCSTGFGGDANTHCCQVCTGQPGSLPSLNAKVVEYAVMAGLALGCEISGYSAMDRKHYVYPDLSKAYQISQYDKPLCKGGKVELSDGTVIRINRIHIEEDAGKLVHSGFETLVDYNRAGIPLIEIVTEPDFRSPEQVVEYLQLLQMTMRHLGISDCKTQEGSLRCDVNISVRKQGETAFGTRTEVKNMNSFSSVYDAIKYEYMRQGDLIDKGARVVQETLGFDDATGRTFSQRDKENADDYRYFPDPDIVPIVVTDKTIEAIASRMPELPTVKRERFVREYSMSDDDARQLSQHKRIADYFECASGRSGDAQTVVSMILTQLFMLLKTDEERELCDIGDNGDELGALLELFKQGRINSTQVKKCYTKMITEKKPVGKVLFVEDMQSVSGDQIETVCREAMDENAQAVKDYQNGKTKALQSLIGAVMKKTRGRADVKRVEEILMGLMG